MTTPDVAVLQEFAKEFLRRRKPDGEGFAMVAFPLEEGELVCVWVGDIGKCPERLRDLANVLDHDEPHQEEQLS